MGGGFLEQIKVRLMEELQTPVAFTIPLFGGIPVTLSVVVSWLVMGVLILAALSLLSYAISCSIFEKQEP